MILYKRQNKMIKLKVMKIQKSVMEVSRPGLVSRPDFMGLGLVSVSSLKGLSLEVQRSRSRSRLLYRDHKT